MTCPTCGHAHPQGGIGLMWCLCNDCFLLFGNVRRESLAPEYLARLKELEALATEENA